MNYVTSFVHFLWKKINLLFMKLKVVLSHELIKFNLVYIISYNSNHRCSISVQQYLTQILKGSLKFLFSSDLLRLFNFLTFIMVVLLMEHSSLKFNIYKVFMWEISCYIFKIKYILRPNSKVIYFFCLEAYPNLFKRRRSTVIFNKGYSSTSTTNHLIHSSISSVIH